MSTLTFILERIADDLLTEQRNFPTITTLIKGNGPQRRKNVIPLQYVVEQYRPLGPHRRLFCRGPKKGVKGPSRGVGAGSKSMAPFPRLPLTARRHVGPLIYASLWLVFEKRLARKTERSLGRVFLSADLMTRTMLAGERTTA